MFRYTHLSGRLGFLAGRGAHEIALAFLLLQWGRRCGQERDCYETLYARTQIIICTTVGGICARSWVSLELKMSRLSGPRGTNIPPLAIHAVPNREKAVAALVI
jgi:hypothetical protein